MARQLTELSIIRLSCPHNVFIVKNEHVIITDVDACMECGACAINCPVSAINVRYGVGCVYGVVNKTIVQKDCCRNGGSK